MTKSRSKICDCEEQKDKLNSCRTGRQDNEVPGQINQTLLFIRTITDQMVNKLLKNKTYTKSQKQCLRQSERGREQSS